MAQKSLNVLLSLKDKFSAPMKKAAQSTKDAERQMKIAQNSINKLAGKANSGFLSMTKSVAGFGAKLAGLVGIGGIGGTIASMKSLSSQSIELANAQLKAETELKTMLGNVKSIARGGSEAVTNASNRLKAYAGDLQNVGVIGDEVTISGMAQLASFQMNEAQIKKVSAGMLDLLAKNKGLNATQEDAVNIANMIGKAMSGNASSMSRVGIIMSDYQQKVIKYGNANQRAAMIAKVLEENVGGMNKALAETDEGKAQQAKNAYGDMLEEFGKELLPIKQQLWSTFGETLPTIQATVVPLLNRMQAAFKSKMPQIKAVIERAVQAIPGLVDSIVGAVEKYYPKIKAVFGFLIDHSNILIGVFATFAAYNFAKKVSDFVAPGLKLISVVREAGGVFKVLNAVMAANPLGVVCVAVGVLVAGMIALYKRSETFRAKCDELFEVLKEFGGWIADTLPGLFDAGFKMISDIVEAVLPNFETTFAAVEKVFTGLIDFIVVVLKGDWSRAWKALGDIVTGIFDGIIESVKGVLKTLKDGLSSGWDKAKSWFTGSSSESNVPKHALGSAYFRGGLARVNENGGELIRLPSGAQIIPHDVSMKAANAAGKQQITINLNVQGNVIGNDEFVDECGRKITDKLKLALGNI